MGPRLVITHAGRETFFPLDRHANIVVGRVESADVVLEDPSVSRVHARLVKLGGAWHVMDLGSRTGTRVNGEPVLEFATPLHTGDAIVLGGVTLRFEE